MYKNKDRVIVHSFGDGIEHPGTVVGLAFEFPGDFGNIYIVGLDQPNPWNHPWDCITVPVGCLRPEPDPEPIHEYLYGTDKNISVKP